MSFVKIYKLTNDGNQDIIATCRLISDAVICEGDSIFIKNVTRDGIYDYSSKPRKKLFPRDGKIFLENLKYAFKSGYLTATDVQDS